MGKRYPFLECSLFLFLIMVRGVNEYSNVGATPVVSSNVNTRVYISKNIDFFFRKFCST